MNQKNNNLWSAPVYAALLAPGLSVLPGLLARTVGGGGWLSVALLPPVLLWLGRLVRGRNGTGLAERVLDRGRMSGVYTFIYIMCAVPLLAVRLRMGARRLAFTAQEGVGLWFFLILLVLAAAWMSWGKCGAFVRAAAVFWPVLLCALGGVCLLALFRLRPEYLWPVWISDIPRILKGGVYALGIFATGVYAVFLPTTRRRNESVWLWVAVGVQALAALCVTGRLGPELAGRLTDPWLTMARGVGVRGTVRRLESLVSALWMLADVAYLGLLTQGVRRLGARWLRKRERWSVPVLLGLAAVLALTVLRDEGVARRTQEQLVPVIGLVVGVVLPVLPAISCGKNKGERHILFSPKKTSKKMKKGVDKGGGRW